MDQLAQKIWWRRGHCVESWEKLSFSFSFVFPFFFCFLCFFFFSCGLNHTTLLPYFLFGLLSSKIPYSHFTSTAKGASPVEGVTSEGRRRLGGVGLALRRQVLGEVTLGLRQV